LGRHQRQLQLLVEVYLGRHQQHRLQRLVEVYLEILLQQRKHRRRQVDSSVALLLRPLERRLLRQVDLDQAVLQANRRTSPEVIVESRTTKALS